MTFSYSLLLGWVGNGVGGLLTMGFHFPRPERPQENLVPNLLLILSIPSGSAQLVLHFAMQGSQHLG